MLAELPGDAAPAASGGPVLAAEQASEEAHGRRRPLVGEQRGQSRLHLAPFFFGLIEPSAKIVDRRVLFADPFAKHLDFDP